jgi:hypothetical protein
MTIDILQPDDLDVGIRPPQGLLRLVEQNLIDLTPWHIMPRELARKRLHGLRQCYSRRYVPFARGQDNDDLAVMAPENPERIVVIHDFSDEGSEVVAEFSSFWDWFRTAIEDMVGFEGWVCPSVDRSSVADSGRRRWPQMERGDQR